MKDNTPSCCFHSQERAVSPIYPMAGKRPTSVSISRCNSLICLSSRSRAVGLRTAGSPVSDAVSIGTAAIGALSPAATATPAAAPEVPVRSDSTTCKFGRRGEQMVRPLLLHHYRYCSRNDRREHIQDRSHPNPPVHSSLNTMYLPRYTVVQRQSARLAGDGEPSLCHRACL